LNCFTKNPVVFRYRGESFKKTVQFKKAIEDFESFLKIVPDSPGANIIRKEILINSLVVNKRRLKSVYACLNDANQNEYLNSKLVWQQAFK
jgi:regulator of sirC expression with transglutaminase-like and TPR domain